MVKSGLVKLRKLGNRICSTDYFMKFWIFPCDFRDDLRFAFALWLVNQTVIRFMLSPISTANSCLNFAVKRYMHFWPYTFSKLTIIYYIMVIINVYSTQKFQIQIDKFQVHYKNKVEFDRPQCTRKSTYFWR